MIATPTVFILGAGASAPYGYPTASQLSKRIYDKIESGPYLRNFEESTGLSEDLARSMAQDLKQSGLPSIDLWLERRSVFGDVGKICIAKEILELEYPVNLHGAEKWYSDLWSQYLLPSGGSEASAILDNQVGFITFNYDRSFEQALMQMITRTYGVETKEAAEIINQFPIVHVYGQVGRLPWQDVAVSPIVREYQPRASWADAKLAAQGIKIIHEANAKTQEFKRARELLYEARRVYFLGFGFHDENLRRLKVDDPNIHFKASPGFFRGSAYKLDGREREALIAGHSPLRKKMILGDSEDGVLEFLKKMAPRV